MKPTPSRPHGALLILLAGCHFASAPVVNGLVEFREFDLDLRFALSDSLMSLVFFGVFLMPIHLGILFLIRRKNLRPLSRTLLVLSPTIVMTLHPFIEALVRPTDSKECFAQRMKHPLPTDATGWRAWYSDGPGESHYMFSFSTTPAATAALLASGPYALVEHLTMLDPESGDHAQLPIGGTSPPKGWPKPKYWDGLKVYSSRENNKYRHILTDGTKSKVFILAGED